MAILKFYSDQTNKIIFSCDTDNKSLSQVKEDLAKIGWKVIDLLASDPCSCCGGWVNVFRITEIPDKVCTDCMQGFTIKGLIDHLMFEHKKTINQVTKYFDTMGYPCFSTWPDVGA